ITSGLFYQSASGSAYNVEGATQIPEPASALLLVSALGVATTLRLRRICLAVLDSVVLSARVWRCRHSVVKRWPLKVSVAQAQPQSETVRCARQPFAEPLPSAHYSAEIVGSRAESN